MKIIDKFADWVLAKRYRYWITQWLLWTLVFLCSTTMVALIFALITK